MATGKGAYFALDNPTTLTNISQHIRSIGLTSDGETVDATVLTSTKREREATYEGEAFVIRMKYNSTSAALARGIKGQTGLDYEYGPEGNGSTKPKISGTVNVLKANSIPNSEPGSLSEIELELNINTEIAGTFT